MSYKIILINVLRIARRFHDAERRVFLARETTLRDLAALPILQNARGSRRKFLSSDATCVRIYLNIYIYIRARVCAWVCVRLAATRVLPGEGGRRRPWVESARRRVECRPKSVLMPKVLTSLSDRGRCNRNNNSNSNNHATGSEAVPTYRAARYKGLACVRFYCSRGGVLRGRKGGRGLIEFIHYFAVLLPMASKTFGDAKINIVRI